MNRNIKILAAAIPGIMLVLSIIAFILNTRLAEGKPYIESISPGILSKGETLHIQGENFGEERASSRIFISSQDILSRYISMWSDQDIEIEIPEKVESGLLTVRTDRGESKPVVLILKENIPDIGTGSYLPGYPFIESIDPPSGKTGDLVTIKGENFGSRKNNSEILFSTFSSRERESHSGNTELIDFLPVDPANIDLWENKTIRLYLPEYVQTGNVYVSIEKGYSNAAYFDQELINSTIVLGEKKTYMIEQTISLSIDSDGESGKVYYWFPSPEESVFQRNKVTLPDRFSNDPFPCMGMNLYSFSPRKSSAQMNLSQHLLIDVYNRNFVVDLSEVNQEYDHKSPVFTKYTQSGELINSDAPRVRSVARSVTKRKYGSYAKARAIFDYILARLNWSEEVEEWSPDRVIDSQIGDSKAYSLLFTALARSSGIPARPITGLLVGPDARAVPHWWAEFYIQGYGWFPLDPSLADRIEKGQAENTIENYWGSIDNLHIAFSRGLKEVPLLFPEGSANRDVNYAFMSHNRETNNGINNLHLNSSGVKITAIY